MDWQAGETIALVVMAVFEAVTLFFYFREKSSKDCAEKELKIIKRRGEAPFLQPSATPFQFIEFIFEKDERRMWTPNEQNVLCFVRDEVTENLAPENAVVFVVDNVGEPARCVVVKLDGEVIALKREIDGHYSQGLLYLEYAYKPQKRGKEQTITISFETRSGVQDTHQYITRHGFRVLRRIDPTLPQ
jgi:hypothetical protein